MSKSGESFPKLGRSFPKLGRRFPKLGQRFPKFWEKSAQKKRGFPQKQIDMEHYLLMLRTKIGINQKPNFS
jgi:hypothetical protein